MNGQPTASCEGTLVCAAVALPPHTSLLFIGGKMPSLDFCLILLLSASQVAAQQDSVCYILDGILIVYAVVLTVLYCRLKMSSSHSSFSEKPDGDIYQDLGHHNQDTYNTLHDVKKKPLA